MIEQLLTITNSVGNSHRSVGLRPWRRTGNFLLIFLQFYVYDLRFKAWGPTTFWLSCKHWLLIQNKATQDCHYSNVIMGDMASQITSISTVCSVVCSGAHQRKHQSSVSLAFVMGIHRWPVDSSHRGPVMRKMFPFDDAIICIFYGMYCTWAEVTSMVSMSLIRKTVGSVDFPDNFIHYKTSTIPVTSWSWLDEYLWI